VAAARLAEVGARDAHPLEVLRASQHRLQQLAVAGLELGAPPQRAARVLNPLRKRVANRLQLAQVQRSRLTRHGGHIGDQLDTREGLGNQGRQLPLEAADLPPQLGASEALVTTNSQRSSRVSFEQIRHTQVECRSQRSP
jgi:transposase